MRILLDESVPSRLADLLRGHSVSSVQQQGWAGVANGKLLSLAASSFDVMITADKGFEYQQNLDNLPLSVLILGARSNRLADIAPLVPRILVALISLPPRSLHKVNAG